MYLLNINIDSIEVFIMVGVVVMLLFFISLLLAYNISQRKIFKHHQQIIQLHQNQQNQLIEAAVKSEEGERHRIAEQLHDEVGAILSASRLYLTNIHSENLPGGEKQLHDKAVELIDEAIGCVRNISHNMHSAILKQMGLNEGIKNFVQKISSGKLTATLKLDESFAGDNESNISIYRILQELMNNIIKHTTATQVNIKSQQEEDKINFIITHDGNGISQQEFESLSFAANGLGLKNIQNRIILLKGSINFMSAEDENKIILSIPLKNKPHAR